MDLPELDPEDKTLEYIAFSSKNWNGKIEDGVITDEGTEGFCITFFGESIIWPDQEVIVHSVQHDPKAKISLRYVDHVRSGVININ